MMDQTMTTGWQTLVEQTARKLIVVTMLSIAVKLATMATITIMMAVLMVPTGHVMTPCVETDSSRPRIPTRKNAIMGLIIATRHQMHAGRIARERTAVTESWTPMKHATKATQTTQKQVALVDSIATAAAQLVAKPCWRA
jgi:hypothetical protein